MLHTLKPRKKITIYNCILLEIRSQDFVAMQRTKFAPDLITSSNFKVLFWSILFFQSPI